MSRVGHQHAKSSAVECRNQQENLFLDAAVRTLWINLVFNSNVPATLSVTFYICGNHFSADCFVNFDQYKAKKASDLLLKKGGDSNQPRVNGSAVALFF